MSRDIRVAMDIGGTFTDFVIYDPSVNAYRTGKVSTTPGELQVGVLQGLDRLVGDLSRVGFAVHGTTAGLNAVLERKGARVALITTEGFRDVYEIGRGNRPELYNVRYRKPKPLVPRRDVYEVRERMRYDGTVLVPLDLGGLDWLVEALRDGGYESIAICLLHAHTNPEHELSLKTFLQDHLPGVSISCSHEVAREWREYERTSTTVLNAYVAPIVERYLVELEASMKSRGMSQPLYVMQSNGGVMTAEVAREHPVQTLLSGPVGGAVGTRVTGQLLGLQNLIGIDMGGTSFDVTLILRGQIDVTNEAELEGFPLLAATAHIHTIGAGGGSIAWLEAGGLRVGPHSAGARPGPACYGRGGSEPTVTDANLVLGRIDAKRFLGGEMRLDRDLAVEAVRRIAQPLGLELLEAAEGILEIANNKMADAIRTITVRKGIDPREFAFVAFGGAGPMHAAFIAELLDIGTIIVPRFPGAFSAWGMLQTDIRHDRVRTFPFPLAEADRSAMEKLYRVMESELSAELARQNVKSEDMTFIRTADMRYVGQEYILNVPLDGMDDIENGAGRLGESFHQKHREVYGHSSERTPVEIVNLRVTAAGRIASHPPKRQPEEPLGSPESRAVQPVVFGGVHIPTAFYDRDNLRPGHEFAGPAVIEELTATTVVPPGWTVRVDGFGNLVLAHRREA